MNFKVSLSIIILLAATCFCCKKSTTATPTILVSTAANIDSITGIYTGITSGDSIFTKPDGSQVLQSFSWPDTLQITSPDSATIIATAKYYTTTYTYGDSLTATDSITTLQNLAQGPTGYVTYNTTLLDTANNINHVIVNIYYTYNKHIISNVTLYKRH